MGLFAKLKKLFSKKPSASEIYKEMYEQKSLDEILQEMRDTIGSNTNPIGVISSQETIAKSSLEIPSKRAASA